MIVIPGTLGSQLINSRTGEVEWPSVLRDDQEDFSLPISPNLSANRDELVPGKIVETLRLGRLVPEVYVYRDLIDALGRYGGYREGDWDNPAVNGDSDTYYVFPYDWRRDNVENARILVTRIERLKESLRRPDLRFNVIAHSMGGLIARYAAMYGTSDLPQVGLPIQPTWNGAQHIEKIVMLGVPNEGSADAFATMLYGYSITEGLRRRVPLLNKLTAEDALTFPALFQLLPHRAATKFLNENLEVVQLNLYDPKVWREYGWGVVNDPEFRRKYANRKSATGETQGETALRELDDYFKAGLERAQRFHEALDIPLAGDPPVTMLAVGGDCEETLDAPVLLKDKDGRWVTLIRPRELRVGGKKRFSKRQVTEAMYAPGDGRVTRRSLLGENLTANSTSNGLRSPLTLSYAVFGCDLHGQLQRNKMLQDNTLTALVSEVMR